MMKEGRFGVSLSLRFFCCKVGSTNQPRLVERSIDINVSELFSQVNNGDLLRILRGLGLSGKRTRTSMFLWSRLVHICEQLRTFSFWMRPEVRVP